jgi:hypothetical protein
MGFGLRLAVLCALTALAALSACSDSPEAPIEAGVCWRLVEHAGKPSFRPVSTGVRNLETCAAHLDAVALREKTSTLTGAYQGQFIFITPEMVQSSLHLDGARYRVFDADTRAKIDRDLRWMLEDETHPSKFGPNAPSVAPPSSP